MDYLSFTHIRAEVAVNRGIPRVDTLNSRGHSSVGRNIPYDSVSTVDFGHKTIIYVNIKISVSQSISNY